MTPRPTTEADVAAAAELIRGMEQAQLAAFVAMLLSNLGITVERAPAAAEAMK